MCESPRKKKLSKIYEDHFDDFIRWDNRKLKLEDKHYKAVNKCKACRTKKLGIVTLCCPGCGIVYTITRNCKHRFCSGCGAGATMKWSEDLLRRILDIKHFHVVFTLPKHLRILSKMNGDKLYNLLFRISAGIMKDWFEKKYKIKPGIISVLHTSGSDLKYHPHVHMIVSSGGKQLGSDKVYKELNKSFLAENEVFGRALKQRYLKALIRLYKKGELKVSSRINTEEELKKRIDQRRGHWIVNIEKPLADLHHIVGYVGRYTKRASVSEYKILETEERIKLKYNDYKNSKDRHGKPLEAVKEFSHYDFLEALLQHVPTERFRMVRYYGVYNSIYQKELPAELKLKEEKIEGSTSVEISEEGYEWGEFEKYRKSFIKAGLADPLWCESCKRDYIIIAIEYEDDS